MQRVRMGALIMRPRRRPEFESVRYQPNQELIKTLRFFEGMGKQLSTWEVEQLRKAEG